MLIERFVNVRRTVTMGGIAWLSMLFIGSLVTRAAGPLFLNIEYFFMFCGFFGSCRLRQLFCRTGYV